MKRVVFAIVRRKWLVISVDEFLIGAPLFSQVGAISLYEIVAADVELASACAESFDAVKNPAGMSRLAPCRQPTGNCVCRSDSYF